MRWTETKSPLFRFDTTSSSSSSSCSFVCFVCLFWAGEWGERGTSWRVYRRLGPTLQLNQNLRCIFVRLVTTAAERGGGRGAGLEKERERERASCHAPSTARHWTQITNERTREGGHATTGCQHETNRPQSPTAHILDGPTPRETRRREPVRLPPPFLLQLEGAIIIIFKCI